MFVKTFTNTLDFQKHLILLGKSKGKVNQKAKQKEIAVDTLIIGMTPSFLRVGGDSNESPFFLCRSFEITSAPPRKFFHPESVLQEH